MQRTFKTQQHNILYDTTDKHDINAHTSALQTGVGCLDVFFFSIFPYRTLSKQYVEKQCCFLLQSTTRTEYIRYCRCSADLCQWGPTESSFISDDVWKCAPFYVCELLLVAVVSMFCCTAFAFAFAFEMLTQRTTTIHRHNMHIYIQRLYSYKHNMINFS